MLISPLSSTKIAKNQTWHMVRGLVISGSELSQRTGTVCYPSKIYPLPLAHLHKGTLTCIEDGNLVSKPYPTVNPVTYKTFYEQLAQAVAGKGEVPVRPEDSRSVIRLVELAKQSSKEGRTLEV